MGKLIENRDLIASQKTAADLVETGAILRAQAAEVDNAITTLIAKIPADLTAAAAADVYKLGQAMTQKIEIAQKRESYKTELATLKTLVSNADYETEIQAEIDLL